MLFDDYLFHNDTFCVIDDEIEQNDFVIYASLINAIKTLVRVFKEIDLLLERHDVYGDFIIRVNDRESKLMFLYKKAAAFDVYNGELQDIILKLFILPKYKKYHNYTIIKSELINSFILSPEETDNPENNPVIEECIDSLMDFANQNGNLCWYRWLNSNIDSVISKNLWKLVKSLFAGNFPIIDLSVQENENAYDIDFYQLFEAIMILDNNF
jgi:hypothetical protein